MKLEFVGNLPKQGTGQRTNGMKVDVLEAIVDALAGDPGEWAVYPWQDVRPDLTAPGVDDKRILSHIHQMQQMAKHGEAPFHEYPVEVRVRRGVGYIRVAPLPASVLRKVI